MGVEVASEMAEDGVEFLARPSFLARNFPELRGSLA